MTEHNLNELIAAHRHTPIGTKLQRVLEYLGNSSVEPGATVRVKEHDYPLFDAASSHEVDYLVGTLVDQGALDRTKVADWRVVTARGWQRLEPDDPGGQPGTVFVAMSFAPALDDAFQNGLATAIRKVGLLEIRADRLEHNEKIDEVVLSKIRQAQVVVADFSGQRQNVYYEAGFAEGLGRIVVRTCHAPECDRLHFDIRQYNFIFWTSAADLATRLEARLRANPNVPVVAS